MTVFCNLIFEETSYDSDHILFIRSKLLGQAHDKGEGNTPGNGYQEAGIIGGPLRSLPTTEALLYSFLEKLPQPQPQQCNHSNYVSLFPWVVQ